MGTGFSLYGRAQLDKGFQLSISTMAFRADRLATLCFFHPLRRLQPRQPKIPILMYHSISASVETNKHPYYRTATAPRVFEEQIRFLHDHGYKSIGLTDAASRPRPFAPSPHLLSEIYDASHLANIRASVGLKNL